jgi:NAD(P)-dependent dehydrogenase (short-subunit alcohol dehydrogenase family)
VVKDFEGRVGVITGAASGIGRAMAERFVAEGMRVVLVDIDEDLDSVTAALEKSGGEVLAVRADVRDRTAMQDVAERTVARFGVVNLVALNAGVGGLQHTSSLTPDMWDWQLGVNIGGVVNGIIAFLPLLIEAADGGHLLLTSSLAAVLGPAYLAPYALAKAGLVGLAESLFFEMQSEGTNVGVSVLCPGPVASAIGEDERHRPAGLPSRSDVDPALDQARDQLRETELNGVSPAAVADQVVEGIRASRLYIFTHPEWTEQAVRTRWVAMVDGQNPQIPVVPDAE